MLLTRTDEVHCFRLLKQHVYYISETNVRLATNMSRDNLISVGTCMGKFTKSGKFHLTIHCLDYMSEYAKVCVDCCLFLLPRLRCFSPLAHRCFLFRNHSPTPAFLFSARPSLSLVP